MARAEVIALGEVAIVHAMNCGSLQFTVYSFQGAVFRVQGAVATAGVELVQDFGK